MKTFTALALLTVLVGAVGAREAGRPDDRNVYGLPDINTAAGSFGPIQWSAAGKIQVFPSNVPSIAWFVAVGQSHIVNVSVPPLTTYYFPTNGAKCINLSPYNGNYYIASDPVIGATIQVNGADLGWLSRLCDQLISGTGGAGGKYGTSGVGLITVGIGGSSVCEWAPVSSAAPCPAGSTLGRTNLRLQIAAQWLTTLGITPRAWLYQQGQADCVGGISLATYASNLRAVISYERGLAAARANDQWIISQDTYNQTSGTFGNGVHGGASPPFTCPDTIAQAATNVGGDTHNFVGPNMDAIPGGGVANTYTDGAHYTSVTGNIWAAQQWSSSIINTCGSAC